MLEKKLALFRPSPYLTFTVHLDGLKEEHDASVCQSGVFERAVAAIAAARRAGFRVNVNCTLFDGVAPERVVSFFDFIATKLDVEGITISPGYAYERAPDQEHFLTRRKSKQLFRDVFARGKGRGWRFTQSSLFLDFLAGNQTYRCTPWGNPTRNVFGWQRPCYLLNEGYAPSFRALMDETDWPSYGTGNYEKCADCMVHCGYEPTAVDDTFAHPLRALRTAVLGVRTGGPMAPEIPLAGQRQAEYVFDGLVREAVERSGGRRRAPHPSQQHGVGFERRRARRAPPRRAPPRPMAGAQDASSPRAARYGRRRGPPTGSTRGGPARQDRPRRE